MRFSPAFAQQIFGPIHNLASTALKKKEKKKKGFCKLTLFCNFHGKRFQQVLDHVVVKTLEAFQLFSVSPRAAVKARPGSEGSEVSRSVQNCGLSDTCRWIHREAKEGGKYNIKRHWKIYRRGDLWLLIWYRYGDFPNLYRLSQMKKRRSERPFWHVS